MQSEVSSGISDSTLEFLHSHDVFFDNLQSKIIPMKENILWKRLSLVATFKKKLFPENSKFRTEFSHLNVGITTNRVFLTAIEGILSTTQGFKLIKKLFFNKSFSPSCCYEIKLCKNERWIRYVIDDLVPFKREVVETPKNRHYKFLEAFKKSNFFPFCNSRSSPTSSSVDRAGFFGSSMFTYSTSSCWLTLLEKVFVLHVGGSEKYQDQTNILPIMRSITGNTSYRVEVSSHLFFSDLVKLRSAFSKVLIFGRMSEVSPICDDENQYYVLESLKENNYDTVTTKRSVLQFSNRVMRHDQNRLFSKDYGRKEQIYFNITDSRAMCRGLTLSKKRKKISTPKNEEKLFVEWNRFQKFFSYIVIYPILHWQVHTLNVWNNTVVQINVRKKSVKLVIQLLQFESIKPVSFRIMSKKEMIFISEFSELSEIKTSEITLKQGNRYYLQVQILDKTELKKGVLKVFANSGANINLKLKKESMSMEKKIPPKIFHRAILSLFSFHQTENYHIQEGEVSVIIRTVKISKFDRLLCLECDRVDESKGMVNFKLGVILSSNLEKVEGVLQNDFQMIPGSKVFLCRLRSESKIEPSKFRIVYKFL